MGCKVVWFSKSKLVIKTQFLYAFIYAMEVIAFKSSCSKKGFLFRLKWSFKNSWRLIKFTKEDWTDWEKLWITLTYFPIFYSALWFFNIPVCIETSYTYTNSREIWNGRKFSLSPKYISILKRMWDRYLLLLMHFCV